MKLRRSGFGLPPTIPSPHARPFLFRWPLFRSSWKFTSSPLRPDGREAFVRIYRRKIGSYKIVRCLLCFCRILLFLPLTIDGILYKKIRLNIWERWLTCRSVHGHTSLQDSLQSKLFKKIHQQR